MSHKLDALGLTAAEGRAGLAKFEVAKAGLVEKGERTADFRLGGEEFESLLDCHVHDITNRFAIMENLEGLGIVASSIAVLAGHVAGGEEAHLEFHNTMPEAGLASATLVVERKAAVRIATHARCWKTGIEFADFIEDLHIGRWCGAGGLTNRRLVDLQHGTEVLATRHTLAEVRMERGSLAGDGVADYRHDNATHEGAFPLTRNAGDDSQAIEWDCDVE